MAMIFKVMLGLVVKPPNVGGGTKISKRNQCTVLDGAVIEVGCGCTNDRCTFPHCLSGAAGIEDRSIRDIRAVQDAFKSGLPLDASSCIRIDRLPRFTSSGSGRVASRIGTGA